MLFLRYWWSRRANMFKWLGWYLFNKNALTPETGNPRKMYYWSKCTKRKRIKYCSYHHWSVKQNFCKIFRSLFWFCLWFLPSWNEMYSSFKDSTQMHYFAWHLSWSPSAPNRVVFICLIFHLLVCSYLHCHSGFPSWENWEQGYQI